MKLIVINSNSKGNAYILESSTGEALLIECGVHFTEIKKHLNFNLRRVAGCLLTHEHGDHSKSVKEVMASGINVYATEGTFRALGLSSSHRAVTTFYADQFKVGSFRVMPFEVKHDVEEPAAFLIFHPECGKIVFITDTYYCPAKFSGLNNIIIEANYCKNILDNKIGNGSLDPKFLKDRVITSHMSLQTCKQTLAANDLTNVMNIVLIHLSDRNSDEKRFRTEVEEQTGKLVHVADAGLTIDFNKKAL